MVSFMPSFSADEFAILKKGMAWRPNIPTPSIVALIPARAGSKRVPNKNIRLLAGHPLLAYTIRTAIESGIFGQVVISSDAEGYRDIATAYGADFRLRPEVMGQDDSPDMLWIKDILSYIPGYDAFAILRPTSPFRTPGTIASAWQLFHENQPADSLRAVRPVTEHPGKMWILKGNRMSPLLPFSGDTAPWHSMPTQSLPRVCVQTAGLEIAWTRTLTETGTISGSTIVPFIPSEDEWLDINTEADWQRAEAMAHRLPKIERMEAVCP